MKRLILVIAILLLIPAFLFAHPGRTASDGCHYCRTNCDKWGVPWGERHCHNRKSERLLISEIKTETKKKVKITAYPGFSGMAQVAANTYLVVHDALSKKNEEDLPRLGLISIETEKIGEDIIYKGINYRELSVDDWSDPEGQSSDLESVCRIGDKEFLAAESGYYKGDFGRLFHFRLLLGQPNEVRVLYSRKLPPIPRPENFTTKKVDQYEGLACKKTSDGRVLVLLGTRGGLPKKKKDFSGEPPANKKNKRGFIHWGFYDPKEGTLELSDKGRKGISVPPPPGFDEPNSRSIASLHLTKEGELWASAVNDHGDIGPFESLIYRIGTVDATGEVPVEIEQTTHSYYIHGYKVESISKSDLPHSNFSFATEDETLGGTWRVLSIK